MVDKIHNITKWILILLLLFAAIATITFYTGVLSEDTLINMGIGLVVATAAITILGALFNIVAQPKSAIKMGISLVVFVVVFGVAYSLAGNHLTPLQLEEYHITEETSKLVGMGLYGTYIFFGLAVLAILYSAVVKAFK
jgi:hypothetical protein